MSLKETKKRKKHVCPVSKYKKTVVHLPRHLRAVHKWSPKKSNSALSMFDLRNKSVREKKVEGNKAARIVRRLHNHLQGKHKLKCTDERYGHA